VKYQLDAPAALTRRERKEPGWAPEPFWRWWLRENRVSNSASYTTPVDLRININLSY